MGYSSHGYPPQSGRTVWRVAVVTCGSAISVSGGTVRPKLILRNCWRRSACAPRVTFCALVCNHLADHAEQRRLIHLFAPPCCHPFASACSQRVTAGCDGGISGNAVPRFRDPDTADVARIAPDQKRTASVHAIHGLSASA